MLREPVYISPCRSETTEMQGIDIMQWNREPVYRPPFFRSETTEMQVRDIAGWSGNVHRYLFRSENIEMQYINDALETSLDLKFVQKPLEMHKWDACHMVL